jgi:cytochrome c peroxidase
MPSHLDQAAVMKMPFAKLFAAGQRIFVTNFNACDGAGRPATTGAGTARTPDPLMGPRFTRVSAPESNSCTRCHAQPQPGGGGDFVDNVFVLAQGQVPVSKKTLNDDFSQAWLGRNTLEMFGSGAIELLGREMTADLQAIKANAITQSQNSGHDVAVELTTKGISFGSLNAHPDGSVDSSAASGVDPDLIVKPFSRKGAFRLVREFTAGAYNQHHGMQSVERFGEETDPDQDGVTDELTIGDLTAVSVFQEFLPTPVRVRAHSRQDRETVARGEALFGKTGCAGCHVPQLPLTSTLFCDPDPNNPDQPPNKTFNDASQSVCFDLQKTAGLHGNMVNAYTDLKRHVICDANNPHYCNEPASPLQPSDTGVPIPSDQFLTAKLWDVGNSAPYGHRGDVDTVFEAIKDHGGEAAGEEANFEALPDSDQSAIVAFLKTLQMPAMSMKRNPPPQLAAVRAHR